MKVAFPDHQMPLYLEGQINDVFIRQALVNIGSSVNILPLSILITAGVPTSKVVRSQISINGYGNSIEINLKIGHIRSFTKFYEIDINVVYHTLL